MGKKKKHDSTQVDVMLATTLTAYASEVSHRVEITSMERAAMLHILSLFREIDTELGDVDARNERDDD